MANALAIRIRKAKEHKTPSASNLAHNSAMTKASYWLNDGANLLQSKSYSNHRQLNEDFNSWISEAKERYLNNPNTKRALRNDAVIIEEGMIIIGTDVKASKEEIHQIILDFAAKFEKDNNTKIRHWSYHDHEGHIDTDGNEQVNRHIHFLFDNVSNDGVMVRRNWKKTYLTQLQDDIHSIGNKYLNIERGVKSNYNTVNIDGREVQINSRQNVKHKNFRKNKQEEERKNQQEKINKLNQSKADSKKSALAKQKQLQEENNKLRETISKLELDSKEKAQLFRNWEQLNRELKALIKNKDLTIDELNAKIYNFSQEFTKKDEKIQDLENTITQISEHTQKLQENKATREDHAKLEQEKINKLNDEVNNLKENVLQKDTKINELLQKNAELEKEIEKKPKIVEKEKIVEVEKPVIKEKIVEKEVEVENTIKIDQLRNQNKALEDEKRVLANKVTTLEKKINSRPNIDSNLQEKFEKQEKNLEIVKKYTEKAIEDTQAPVTSFQSFINWIVKSYNELKQKLTNLSKENESLKAENESLKRQISTYQSANDLSKLVNDLEVSEAERHIQEHLDNLDNSNKSHNVGYRM